MINARFYGLCPISIDSDIVILRKYLTPAGDTIILKMCNQAGQVLFTGYAQPPGVAAAPYSPIKCNERYKVLSCHVDVPIGTTYFELEFIATADEDAEDQENA